MGILISSLHEGARFYGPMSQLIDGCYAMPQGGEGEMRDLGIRGKCMKHPHAFIMACLSIIIHPGTFWQKWNIQITISPVIQKLIKGVIFE